jgi:hypothetical protein
MHGRNPRSNGKILLTTDQVFFLLNFRQGNVKLVLFKEFKPIFLDFANENYLFCECRKFIANV